MRRPLFLARQSYRRRRLHDMARLLPVFGTFLMILPMLWGEDDSDIRNTASDGLYLLITWIGLIIVAAALSRGLRAQEDEASPPSRQEDR
jgi:hypothetical protein